MGSKIRTNHEKRKRRIAFRRKIILSFFLVLLGAVLFLVGYYGHVPFSPKFILLISGGLIIGGLLINMTTFSCPFCGSHINKRGLFLKFFYICPYCDFRANGKYVEKQNEQ